MLCGCVSAFRYLKFWGAEVENSPIAKILGNVHDCKLHKFGTTSDGTVTWDGEFSGRLLVSWMISYTSLVNFSSKMGLFLDDVKLIVLVTGVTLMLRRTPGIRVPFDNGPGCVGARSGGDGFGD